MQREMAKGRKSKDDYSEIMKLLFLTYLLIYFFFFFLFFSLPFSHSYFLLNLGLSRHVSSIGLSHNVAKCGYQLASNNKGRLHPHTTRSRQADCKIHLLSAKQRQEKGFCKFRPQGPLEICPRHPPIYSK